ncbi:MAG TPA: hypothetical protein VJT31_11980, partial [Rugosimonospora sp.]|nr:hypothetical protein [Rugosimonospora sp.]
MAEAPHLAGSAPAQTFTYHAILQERREALVDLAGRMAALRVLAQRSRSAGDAAAANLRALVDAARNGDASASAAFRLHQRALEPVVALLRRVAVLDRPAMALARAEVWHARASLVGADAGMDLTAAAALDAELVEVSGRARAAAQQQLDKSNPPLPDGTLLRDLLRAASRVAEAEDRTATTADPAATAARTAARAAALARYVPT